MPALLQAFARLVALKRLGVLLFVVAATLCASSTASAFEHPQTKTRVWGFELLRNNSSGLLTLAISGKHQGNRSAQSELASDSLLAAEGVAAAEQGAFSRILNFTERDLQKGFTKHGGDFGLSGNWNPGRAGDFSRAINTHINDVGVIELSGTYRGAAATHFFNPATGVNVIATPGGQYISGWQLGVGQLENMLRSGALR